MGTPDLSIIVPVYNEEDNVPLLHAELKRALDELDRDYEIIYVDDGSRDASFERLQEAIAHDPTATLIRFRRNFGQTAAIAAGIEHSQGEILVLMDADLQNDPADIGKLVGVLETGYDVVSGWREERHDELIRRKLPSWIANKLISAVTGVHLHDYGCTLKAYRREVLESVRLYGEMHRFIPVYASCSGARLTEIPVHHRARRFGKSKYGLSRTVRVLLDLMTVKFLGSYSTKPLYAFGYIGVLLFLASFASVLLALGESFVPPYVRLHNNPLTLLGAVLLVLAMQVLLMGLLAELVMRTYYESQGKPTYITREVLRGAAPMEMSPVGAAGSRGHDGHPGEHVAQQVGGARGDAGRRFP
jgi:glycosyltransferase involved in cell wall biosynthesis